MGIKTQIKEAIGYRLSVGEPTVKKLIKLYKKDPEYVNLFLKEIKTLKYGDEKRRKEINKLLKEKSIGKRYNIHIIKPGKKTDKFERHLIKVTV